MYIDLAKNPERYTGYAGITSKNLFLFLNIKGEASWKVWRAIYVQNCFDFIYGPNNNRMLNSEKASTDNMCVEKRSFYRVISGMHASISAHLCQDYLNKETNTWVCLN